MSPEREFAMSNELWDAIIVGGGPAGITAALKLAREDLDVLVVEAAVYPGAENWSGAVYFAEGLADPAVLGPDELERAPYERRVVKRGFFATNGPTLAGVEYRDPGTFEHCYTVLRPVYDRYLAELARRRGVTFLNETTVDGLIRHGDVVVGVHTDRGSIYGEIVFLAEGDASHLVSKEGFERDAVRSKKAGQPAFLQGVKEVIELDPETIQERFGVGPGEACCYEVLLRNGALDGRPVRLNMASFIYTNRSSVSIGLVMPLENLAEFGGDYNTLMEWYKGLPPVARLLEGGTSTSYGAKIIRGGGLKELPQLVDHGVAIGGAATGIGVDFPYPNFTGPATAMGSLFADAVLELRKGQEHPLRERLEELYVEPLKQTHYYKDVEHLRDWPAFIEHSQALFGRQIDLLNGGAYVLTRPDLGTLRKLWESVRLVGETMKGRWLKTLNDLRGGSKALHIGRYMLKHAPLALLLSIPNTILAFVPFVYGKGRGELKASFWVKDEEPGQLPWYKRWAYARYRSALANAAHVLYANDGVPIARKLDRCVGIVSRRFSLWEIVTGIVGGTLLVLTRLVQRLSDAIRYARKKPTLEELQASFYGRWLTRWRELTDLSAGAARKTHDAKLSEISYGAEAGSHIKVFFPPEKPGALEDPSKSSLWSVCPAAVYQVNVDRTLHASVAVNFENCVKCESCWRIEPGHVDWSRFGKHRLIYEVYTEADGALRRVLAERELAEPTDVAASYWTATLSEDWPEVGAEPQAPAELANDVTAARRAIDRAGAYCDRLTNDVWHGPRVLEPGQVAWYDAALDYFAVLAEEAASAALAESIEDWLLEHELTDAHVELLQLQKDLTRLTRRIREHAGGHRFFMGVADARQLRDHYLAGLREIVDRIADVCLIPAEYSDPVAELQAQEQDGPARTAARAALRDHLADVFDRSAIRRLEEAGDFEDGERELLAAAARAVLGDGAADGGFDGWSHLEREDILAELSRFDPSLGAVLAAHLAAAEALLRAGASGKAVDELVEAKRFAGVALEAEAEPGDGRWTGRLPFAFAGLAERFVARGGGRIGLFEPGRKVRVEATPAIGLAGARPAELTLDSAKPVWSGEWEESDERTIFALRARDAAALALGSSDVLTERAVDHAVGRIQFPDMFQDLDGRDGVGKFGAVRAHLSHIEASRLAIETLLRDVDWSGDAGLEAAAAKVAVTDLYGPDMPSVTYRAGQVIGGSAFSEEDIFSKMYRDSAVFPHYIRPNAELNVEIGVQLAGREDGIIAGLAPHVAAALDAPEQRPVLDFEVRRLREAERRLRAAMTRALNSGNGAKGDEAVHDIVGGLATRLLVWARLLLRAHRRWEGALPTQRYVEAAQLWADVIEERLIGIDDELDHALDRVDLGGYAFQLADYPDVPIASQGLGFDYKRDIIDAERNHRSGEFLVEPFVVDETRYFPELQWADETIADHYREYMHDISSRFGDDRYDPSFERQIERLHYITRDDIDWTLEQGYFRVVIPEEYGGQGRSKADYYNLCQLSKRHGDVSHTLTIQANTSIGTTPMLLGLEDVDGAQRELEGAMEKADDVDAIRTEIEKLIEMMAAPDLDALKDKYIEIDKLVRGSIGKSRILKKAVFGKFASAWGKAGAAGMKKDLAGFKKGLEKALAAMDGWRDRVAAQQAELPRRRAAHEFYLRLIAARMISAFALTEPSAGSDTARVRTEARLDSRRVHTDEDGVKYFYLDEENQEERRNLAEMDRFQFDGRRIFYRYSDDADPAEVLSQEYVYEHETDTEKFRYFMIGDRRVDIHDMAQVRQDDGAERYEFFVLNGAKMWITNGHIAGVEAIYARTPTGVTGFMVDALTEGFFVGKDEEKTGQRGSPTNEITLTNVRIPRECMIGIEGRGQENALETLNVGRAGLCISSSAGIEQAIGDAADYLEKIPRGAAGWARYRLGLAMEEMFAIEAISYDLIGIYDDDTSDKPRVESSIGKLFGTDGLHRTLHHLEALYGVEGLTRRYRIEKDRRDARVMTIYEGTNEIQQFLLLKDLIDMMGPQIEKAEEPDVSAEGSPYAVEVEGLRAMHEDVRARVKDVRATYKSAAWQRALLQPIFFRLARMVTLLKMVDATVRRAHWIARNLNADGDELHRKWSERAARGFIARARRAFDREVSGFDRDLGILQNGGRPTELKLAETLLDESEAAEEDGERRAIERTPIDRELKIAVALQRAPRLAPRPRLADGDLAEHVYGLGSGDRRALRAALELKAAAPDRVHVTLICAAPLAAEDDLRAGLAAGADRAILLDTGGVEYEEHAVAEAIADAFRRVGLDFHLLLAGVSGDGPGAGRLGLRLARELDAGWVPDASDVWVADGHAVMRSQRFAGNTVAIGLPAVGSIVGSEDEPDPEFETRGFVRALRAPLEVIPFPTDAERSQEELSTVAAQAGGEETEEEERIDPERAAEVLVEVGDLGDGAGAVAAEAEPYDGDVRKTDADALEWTGVVFIAELQDDDLARSARAPLDAAQALAARARLPLSGLVLSEKLTDERRRAIAGRLRATAAFTRIVFAEHDALASGAPRAYAEALEKLVGPGARSRPDYLLSTPWLADAMPMLAESLRDANVRAEEVAGVSRIELGEGDRVEFVHPAYERKLRARRRLPLAGDGVRILWFEPEVNAEGGNGASAELDVARVALELEYDPRTDALAEALAEAKEALGVVTLENAEFIIDVGAGLGSVDNLETVVEPLRQALLEMGAPHVLIGATRKVTMDMSWLPEDRQIGQTGVRVNPRIMIALGVSGAPQHIDWVGDRAVIFAFNLDPQAPLMTLNQRREQPKVYPVVGNLLETVPRFVEALKQTRA